MNFVTYFSSGFAIYALALIDSIKEFHFGAKIYVMPLDKDCINILNLTFADDPSIFILDNSKIVNQMHSYQIAGRSFAESVYSVKPNIIQSAYSMLTEGDVLLYCDSDIYFFENFPADLFEGADALIFEHIFAVKNIQNVKYGKFNAGLVGFRKSKVGSELLDWWSEKCNENCTIVLTESTFSDQKYLEQFPGFSNSVITIRRESINQSLWIIDENSKIEFGPKYNGGSIICFHFHGLRASRNLIFTDLFRYGVPKSRKAILEYIYSPYISTLSKHYPICAPFLQRKKLPLRALFRMRFLYKKWHEKG